MTARSLVLVLPLGAFLIGLGVAVGGRPGQILVIVGTRLCGVAAVLVFVD